MLSTAVDQNAAAELYESISDFKDSNEKAEKCRKMAEAYLVKNKTVFLKKIITTVLSICGVICTVFFLVMLFTEIIPSSKYNTGLRLIEEGNYEEAYEIFTELGDYKDSVQLLNTDPLCFLQPYGSTVKFGNYEWYIIGKNMDGITLLCKDIVDKRKYNDSWKDITWENCTLRKWLNEDFYNQFSYEEKKRIGKTWYINKNNSKYGTDGGYFSTDYVYILSIDEAKDLSEYIIKCDNTFWLRSPGEYQVWAALVDWRGDIWEGGTEVTQECGVRPVIKIVL